MGAAPDRLRQPGHTALGQADLLGGGALLVVGGVHAPDAFLALAGEQGTATIAYADMETGSHGTKYIQCWVDLPDGNTEQLPRTGPCPAPDGAHRPVVYSPGGVVGPILGSRGT